MTMNVKPKRHRTLVLHAHKRNQSLKPEDSDDDLLAACSGQIQVWTLNQVKQQETGGRPVLGADGDCDLVVTILNDQEHHGQSVRGHLDT